MSFARQSLGSLLALVFGVAVSVMLPRVLGPEARGEYQLAVGGVLLPRQALGPTLAWLVGEILLAGVAIAYLWRMPTSHSGNWRPEPTLARELARSGAPIQFGLLGMFLGSEGGAFVLNA